ncbi:unnamed protein product [Lactuca saligna]|uniref:Serine-threonine/tyrosine-protein kinase catalytic domain-containing protein n=1 Tax=Lactuca saligna TaxID=75948 RepID=A0AA36EKF6_LACSI|nr:unnamed protein product [Lactuca saligna]
MRASSQLLVVRIHPPQVLVVPDFLLAVGEFFVPALGAINGKEEVMQWILQAHTVLEMNYTDKQLTATVVSKGLRPGLAGTELGAPPRLLSLVQRCWEADMHNRSSFDDIISKLDLNIVLPWLEGTGLVVHEKALGKVFHVQCLHIPSHDRTPFEVWHPYGVLVLRGCVEFALSCSGLWHRSPLPCGGVPEPMCPNGSLIVQTEVVLDL